MANQIQSPFFVSPSTDKERPDSARVFDDAFRKKLLEKADEAAKRLGESAEKITQKSRDVFSSITDEKLRRSLEKSG
jgi:hypothetical protein